MCPPHDFAVGIPWATDALTHVHTAVDDADAEYTTRGTWDDRRPVEGEESVAYMKQWGALSVLRSGSTAHLPKEPAASARRKQCGEAGEMKCLIEWQ